MSDTITINTKFSIDTFECFIEFCEKTIGGSRCLLKTVQSLSPTDRVLLGNEISIGQIDKFIQTAIYHPILGMICLSPRVHHRITYVIRRDTDYVIPYESLIRYILQGMYEGTSSEYSKYLLIPSERVHPVLVEQVTIGCILAYVATGCTSYMSLWMNCVTSSTIDAIAIVKEHPLLDRLERDFDKLNDSNAKLWDAKISRREEAVTIPVLFFRVISIYQRIHILCYILKSELFVAKYPRILAELIICIFRTSSEWLTISSQFEHHHLMTSLRDPTLLQSLLQRHNPRTPIYDTAVACLIAAKYMSNGKSKYIIEKIPVILPTKGMPLTNIEMQERLITESTSAYNTILNKPVLL